MADLTNRVTLDPPLASRAPERPLLDRGPGVVDAETVAAFAAQVQSGLTRVPPEAEAVVGQVSDDVLDATFARHLAASPLQAGTALPHRVLALTQAVIELCQTALKGVQGDVPLAPSGVQVGLAIQNLELYASSRRGLLMQVLPDAPEEVVEVLLSKVALVTSEVVSELTGLSAGQLAAMRNTHVGPAFVKLPNMRKNIRYPLIALIDWMYAQGVAK